MASQNIMQKTELQLAIRREIYMKGFIVSSAAANVEEVDQTEKVAHKWVPGIASAAPQPIRDSIESTMACADHYDSDQYETALMLSLAYLNDEKTPAPAEMLQDIQKTC